MLRRLFLTFTLALLFGLGQQGAVTHAFSHLADAQQHDRQQDQSHHSSTCDKCVVYAELGSAIGSTPLTLPVATPSFKPHPATAFTSRPVLYQPYSARAPPTLG